jgi:hypothetical protein
MTALKIASTSEPPSPARAALRAAIRDIAAARDALDRAEQPCQSLQALIGERDRAKQLLASSRDADPLAVGDWLATRARDRPETPSSSDNGRPRPLRPALQLWRRQSPLFLVRRGATKG